jgi:hypothetical protein
MQNTVVNKLLHITLLHRGVALLFFILIFADIASPELCCEELNDISGSGSNYTSIQSLNSNPSSSFINSTHSEQDEHSKCRSSDEGCFCCCAHFIVSKSIFITSLLSEESSVDSVQISLLMPPLRSMFHPPRSV